MLISPLSRILSEVGRSVADTQKALDRNSIETQMTIDSDEGMGGYDIEATWYHIPEVDIELKLSLSMEYEEERDSNKRIRGYKPVLHAAPLNASYGSLYGYDVKGSSTLKAKIVVVPPATASNKE
ncbi:hypothetical protein HNV12_18995 [Methanococcoides sp. SA1]|nr:hypothetical protein [Methanococcoides sp. SA1]